MSQDFIDILVHIFGFITYESIIYAFLLLDALIDTPFFKHQVDTLGPSHFLLFCLVVSSIVYGQFTLKDLLLLDLHCTIF